MGASAWRSSVRSMATCCARFDASRRSFTRRSSSAVGVVPTSAASPSSQVACAAQESDHVPPRPASRRASAAKRPIAWRPASSPPAGVDLADDGIGRHHGLFEPGPGQSCGERLAKHPAGQIGDQAIPVRRAHHEREVAAADQVDRERRPGRGVGQRGDHLRDHGDEREGCNDEQDHPPRVAFREEVEGQSQRKDRPEREVHPECARDGVCEPGDQQHDPDAGRPIDRIQP